MDGDKSEKERMKVHWIGDRGTGGDAERRDNHRVMMTVEVL